MWPQKEDVVKVTNVMISDFLKSQTDLEWKRFCVSYSLKHRSKKLGHIWSSTLSSPSSQLPIILSKTPQRRRISKLGGYKVADGISTWTPTSKTCVFSSTFHHHVDQSS